MRRRARCGRVSEPPPRVTSMGLRGATPGHWRCSPMGRPHHRAGLALRRGGGDRTARRPGPRGPSEPQGAGWGGGRSDARAPRNAAGAGVSRGGRSSSWAALPGPRAGGRRAAARPRGGSRRNRADRAVSDETDAARRGACFTGRVTRTATASIMSRQHGPSVARATPARSARSVSPDDEIRTQSAPMVRVDSSDETGAAGAERVHWASQRASATATAWLDATRRAWPAIPAEPPARSVSPDDWIGTEPRTDGVR